MSALILHPDWELAKRMALEWHPAGQFMIFVEGKRMPWYGLVADGHDDEHTATIKAFGEFCSHWQPELKKRGIKIAEPTD